MNTSLLIGAIICAAVIFLLKINIDYIVQKRGATNFDYFVMLISMIMSFVFLISAFVLILLFIKSCL